MAKDKTNWATCSQPGCEDKVHGQGMCHIHYGRAYRAKVKQSADGRLKPYEPIDMNAFWEWCKKELNLA